MVTSSFSGLLWAPEVRDCASGRDLLRRVQTIIFSPQALLNCWRIPNAPWKQVNIEKNLQNELMEEQEYYTSACWELFELRMQLLPYLYSAFVEYHKYGVPPVRAMVLDDPDDLEVRNIDDQYYFGKNLLVCPLTLEDGEERRVYLPKGRWYDFFGNESYDGNCWMMVEAKENQIPVFVRDGAIIPLAQPMTCVGKEPVFDITIRSYGQGEGEFMLYEDDFTTFDYEESKIREIPIRRNQSGTILIPDAGQSQRYRFHGQNTDKERKHSS